MIVRRQLAPLALATLLLAPATVRAQDARRTVEARIVNDGRVVLEDVPDVPDRIARQLNRYQNVRSASLQDFTTDGDGVYVTTRFGQVTQLHRVGMPLGARTQITFYGEPVSGVSRRPGGASLLFGMDEGGSEFYQLFLLDEANGEARRLTDGESRNGSARWSRNGRKLAYRSTRRNGRSNDIWVMSVDDTSSARAVVEAPDGSWYGPADWDRTGRRLLVSQYVSIADSRIHLLDLKTGGLELLLGGEESPASYLGVSPTFSADGHGVFVATDAFGEFTQLAYLDLKTRDLSIITGSIPWGVQSFQLSDDGGRAAFLTNEEGVSRLYLLDPATHHYAVVEGLPGDGLIRGLEFGPHGRQLGFTLNSATTPSDVFVLELGRRPLDYREVVRWTKSEVGGLDTESFMAPTLVDFPTFDAVDGETRRIPAFLYLPEGPGPHPVIVYIHGGPESQYRPGFSSTFQLWLAELGAAVIAPNVRGSSGYGKEYVKLDNGFLRENSVRDIGALLDWIAARPDLDEDRVVVYGGSYGGYMVLASLVHYSDRLLAGVDVVGISNFVTFLENTQDYRRDLRRAEYGDERDPEMRAHLDQISPDRHAEKIEAPLLVAQGQNDPRVPVTESDQIVAEVRAAGFDVWYMKALNEGHGFRRKENRDLFNQIVVLFFDRYRNSAPTKPRSTAPHSSR